jgi:transposase InsO family protein
MRWKSHVRFGGRAGETHRSKDDRALRSDPYTYIPTWAGFLYPAIVLDVFSCRIVGWAMEGHLRTELVLAALQMAAFQRRPGSVIHHSDQGCQLVLNGSSQHSKSRSCDGEAKTSTV